LFNENPQHPTSTAEVARALNVPTILIVASDKEGIEGAVINAFSYATLMKKLDVKVKGVIFNKAKITYLSDEMKTLIERVFGNLGVQVLGFVPRIDLEGRGMIPEVEIRYEDFGAKAIETIEKAVDIKALAEQAEILGKTSLDHERFLENFKRVITVDSELKPQGERKN
jgi:cobyrinic acid a,c-diamide synthase